MIIGYSHVTLSSTDLDRDAAWLKGLGFSRRFVERGLVNDPQKTPYLQTAAGTMSLAYCEAPGSLAVELVSYERWADSSVGNYELLFEVPAEADIDAPDPGRWGAVPHDVFSGAAGSMKTRLSFTRGRRETGRILGVRTMTADVEREVAFWCEALGCRAGAAGGPPRWATASFASPVPQWRADLLFVEGGQAPPPQMDSPGSTCLSVLVKGLEETAQRAADAGALSVSEPFGIEVDGKTLEMAIVRTPGGAIVELMESNPGGQGRLRAHG